MMLDSSIGKILKNKPVEPSIPANHRLSPSKEIQSASSNRSEAEVRLVVRFFVEEHIVFNGKIEKVKQLESEELSRIVSRIEWDDSKSSPESQIQIDHLLTDAIEDAPREEKDPSSPCKISNNSPASSDPSDQQRETYKTDGQVQESTSTIAHEDTIIKSSLKNDSLVHGDETTIAQDHKCEEPMLDDLKADQPCDMYSAEHSKHINYIDFITETQKSTLVTTKKIKDEPSVKVSTETRYDEYATNPEFKNGSLDAVDRQTIVDTLNDCVSSIEMEFHKLNEKISYNISTRGEGIRQLAGESRETTPTEQPPFSISNFIDSEQVVSSHNTSICRHFDKSGKRPLMDVPSDSGLDNVKQANCFTDLKILSDQMMCKDDLSMRMVPENRPENLSPNRRRNTVDNGPPNKRIRRLSVKDGCKGLSTDRHIEKQPSKRGQKVSTRLRNFSSATALAMRSVATSNASVSTANHLVRSSRIFAKWTDNHFYPGTILKPSKDRKFTIGFFDGAQRNVAEIDLIPSCNILGKQVRVSLAGDYCVNAIVHDKKSSPADAEPLFDVEYQQDGVIRKCVPMKDIFLTADQGATLINQPIRPDKNPDESMFAGVDLDNIVHVKRSRRLQEMEDSNFLEEPTSNNQEGSRKKRNQYNTRNTNNRSKISANISDPNYPDGHEGQTSCIEVNPDIPASSCSPDTNSKPNLGCLNSNPPSESNSSASTGSSNATNGLEMGREFYFDSSSPHRTKTSLLL